LFIKTSFAKLIGIQISFQPLKISVDVECGIRAVSAALHTPSWETTLSQGPNIQSSHHLAPEKKASTPILKYEALEISEFGGSLDEKCVNITVTFGPFESKILTHYNCCWGPLWQQSSLLIHYSCCWALSKARHFTHYRCSWGPLWKGSEPTYALHLLFWASLKA